MKRLMTLLAIVVTAWPATARAVTIEEIIRLKQAGIADSTIELLIRRDVPFAGVWKEDGWIVYSTKSRFPDVPRVEDYQSENPMTVYPEIYGDKHPRSR